jgi:agmatine/peptidylarginine deiminase
MAALRTKVQTLTQALVPWLYGMLCLTNRNRTGLPFVPFLLLILLHAPSLRGQAIPTPAQRQANDVVVLSLQALDPRVEHRQHVREGLVGNFGSDLNVEKRLLEIQMNIVRETAKFGPVLLLAPDETTRNLVYQRCREFQICELFKFDRVRMKVVPHDGLWIRDFGPQIEAAGDSAYVIHWRYFDIRTEEAKREKQQELEATRLKLLESRQQEDQPDAFSQESTPEARKAAISAIDDKLYLLREYSEILNEASPQRSNDEDSAYDIADAVLAVPDFNYKTSPVSLDGGNLLKLDDGRCLTTRVLLSRNKDRDLNVDQELEKIGGCKDVTYLDPLPGPVIEHIDMFALPVAGNRILLASYDLSSPFSAKYWSQLSDAERDLALNADLTMKLDAERLRRLGYEVVSVPSPFPRIPPNGHTYYPSVLNALVRTGSDGSRQVLAPSYKDDEPDIQSAALKQIQAAFGPKTEIVTIEATAAAKSQGAIHCLTLTAPLPLSIFGDSAETAMRTESLARKEQLDQNAATEIASRIPAAALRGSWVILEQDEQPDDVPLEFHPQRIFFGQSEFQKGVFDQLESQGRYSIDKMDRASWSVHFVFADQNVTSAVVQWLSKDEVKLFLGDGDSTLVLRRIASGDVSPFKQVSKQAGKGIDSPHKKHPSAERPPTSTGQAPPALEPIQP